MYLGVEMYKAIASLRGKFGCADGSTSHTGNDDGSSGHTGDDDGVSTGLQSTGSTENKFSVSFLYTCILNAN